MDRTKLDKLIDYALQNGSTCNSDGRWSVSYDDLSEHFGEIISKTNENGLMLAKELRQREEINELIMTEDAIEMAYHMEFCENCQQDGIVGIASLISLIGCNIYDEHEEGSADQSSDEEETPVLQM